MEKTRQNSEELLEKAKESLGDLDVETILIEEPIGRVADNIVEIAKEKDVDLIVMGSNGIGSLGRRLYLGSVTNKVLHMTKKPVMVIH
jgi:nucleotide-binding universal stress UspA family protein